MRAAVVSILVCTLSAGSCAAADAARADTKEPALVAGSALVGAGLGTGVAGAGLGMPNSGIISGPVTAAPTAPTVAATPGWAPVPVPVADRVVVHKSERRLYLLRHGEVLRSYKVALGLVPDGPKARAGDFRTPEGRYYLTRRNPRSDYFLSILVSYPNDQDQLRARHEHADPGGSIMIHGLPNSLRHSPDYYEKSDWTDGCIALSDSDMVEVWLMTRANTPIEILP